jgi:hypothetical protein
MTSCAGVVPDADIAIRAACTKKLFLEEACPVCFGELGRSVAICNEGHAMCVACNAAWSGGCPVCRDRTVEVVTLADDEHDLAFERDMRVAASMLPHERAVPADVPTATARTGVTNGSAVAISSDDQADAGSCRSPPRGNGWNKKGPADKRTAGPFYVWFSAPFTNL